MRCEWVWDRSGNVMGVGMGMGMEIGMGMDRMRCEWVNGWNEMHMGMDGMRYKWEWIEEDANGNGGTS